MIASTSTFTPLSVAHCCGERLDRGGALVVRPDHQLRGARVAGRGGGRRALGRRRCGRARAGGRGRRGGRPRPTAGTGADDDRHQRQQKTQSLDHVASTSSVAMCVASLSLRASTPFVRSFAASWHADSGCPDGRGGQDRPARLIGPIPAERATGPVDSRMIRRVSRRTEAGRSSRPSIMASSSRTAVSPFSRIGWWTVVSGGCVCWPMSMSSKPTTDRSLGHAQARARGRRAARRSPSRPTSRARRSDAGRPPRSGGAPRSRPRSSTGPRRRPRATARSPRPRGRAGSRACARPPTPSGLGRRARRRTRSPPRGGRGGRAPSRCCRGRERARPRRRPRSSAVSGSALESTMTSGRPAARSCSTSACSRGHADRDHAVDHRPLDRAGQRPVERRDEVERVALLLGGQRDALRERPEERVGEDDRQRLRREDAQRERLALGEHARDRVRAVAQGVRDHRGCGVAVAGASRSGLLNANDTAVFETPASRATSAMRGRRRVRSSTVTSGAAPPSAADGGRGPGSRGPVRGRPVHGRPVVPSRSVNRFSKPV